MGTFRNDGKHTTDAFMIWHLLSVCVCPLKGCLRDGSGALDTWDCHCVECLTLGARWEGGCGLQEEMFLGNPDFIKSMRMKYPRQDDQLFTSEAWCPSALIESRLPGPPNASVNEHILPWAADTFKTWYKVPLVFQSGASGKEPACQSRRRKRGRFDPWVRKITLEEGMATQTSILAWRIPWMENPLGGYSICGCKESDVTEATQHTHVHKVSLGKGFYVSLRHEKGSDYIWCWFSQWDTWHPSFTAPCQPSSL